MSIEKRVTFDGEGQPKVVITVTGWHDVFRFSWAMAHLQCDFADVARRIGGTLKRRIGAARFQAMNAHFTGNESLGWVRDDTTDLSTGHRSLTATELRQIADLLDAGEEAFRALERITGRPAPMSGSTEVQDTLRFMADDADAARSG